jgi:hypothetical protein
VTASRPRSLWRASIAGRTCSCVAACAPPRLPEDYQNE